MRFGFPPRPPLLVLCAVAEKFEKWKLMINDIADQPGCQQVNGPGSRDPVTGRREQGAGSWELDQKLSTHLTHENVGQYKSHEI